MAENRIMPFFNLYMQIKDTARTEEIYGTKLKELIREYKKFWINGECTDKEASGEAFKALLEELPRTVFLVPFNYRDDRPGTEDKQIHLSNAAADMINRDAIVQKAEQMSIEQMDRLGWTVGNDGTISADMNWWDVSRIGGSEGYSYAEGGSSKGMMYPITLTNENGEYYIVFTDIGALKEFFGDRKCPHICLFSLYELLLAMMQKTSVPGFIINVNTDTHCFINKSRWRQR
ncbi:MAG: SseB family protein [Solobacterium sp.]|nr:SseB family protein [Solobacterium sp.]